MPKQEKNYLVKMYHIICAERGFRYEYDILAVNIDWALTCVSTKTDWKRITVTRKSGVVARAEFGCRDVTGLNSDEYLYYHAEPFYS